MYYNEYTLGALACQVIANSFITINLEDRPKHLKQETICITSRTGKQWNSTYIEPKDLKSAIQKLDKTKSYYITNQSLVGTAKRRTTSQLFGLHNIVMDIDAHEYLDANEITEAAFHEKIQELITRVQRDTCEIPPNFAVETGRGVQFWWNFEETSKVLLFAYTRAVNTLFRVLTDIIDEYPELKEMFQVDPVSKRAVGLFRLPGSYNPKRNCFTEIHTFHENKYNFFEFNDYISDKMGLKWEPGRKKGNRHTGKKITPITKGEPRYMPLLHKRVRIIENQLAQGKIKKGKREIALFLYFNTVRQLSAISSPPDELTRAFNSKLEKPLSEAQLQAIFRNRTVYHMKEKTFLDYLGINKEEVMTISNFTRDLERKTRIFRRNEEVKFRIENGEPITQIAKKMGLSRQTVYNVIKELGLRQ